MRETGPRTRETTQPGTLSTFDTRLEPMTGPVDNVWVPCGKRQIGGGRPRGSDLKSHPNDCLSDRSQAGVVVAGVPAHELVGVLDRDRSPLRGDPLGLLDDDP